MCLLARYFVQESALYAARITFPTGGRRLQAGLQPLLPFKAVVARAESLLQEIDSSFYLKGTGFTFSG